jgi:lactoylglutathione lyase
VEKARSFYTGVLGYPEAYSLKVNENAPPTVYLKVNDEQYILLTADLKESENQRLSHIAMLTSDIHKAHSMLSERGVMVTPVVTGTGGSQSFTFKDPDGNLLEIVEYRPGSNAANARGKFVGENRISLRLRHAGVIVASEQAAMAFYRDKLGFRETWRGGPAEGQTRWINLRIPGAGDDYLELMLYSPPLTRQSLGSMQHICLEVPDIEAAYRAVLARSAPGSVTQKPSLGRNRKWLLNLFDPDGSRTELMEPRTVEQ